MHDASDSSAVLFDLADQLLADLEHGRLQPLAHYLARFPGHEESVAREYLAFTGVAETTSAPTARRLDQVGRVGPYALGAVLGRGGQGVVYRAIDARLERTVALKVLTLSVASVSQGRRTRFRREAEIVARLDHPGICTVLDADLDAETPYIAMRFVEGETLGATLARAREARAAESDARSTTNGRRLAFPERALELAETLSFFERAARALHAAHEAGVVHRDVKPGNIMVSKDGSPVLLDFGLARGDEESALLTRSDEVFGTPAYISPEQLVSGRDVDRRTDVYSLGVVLYECLTLERPFQGESSAQLVEAIRAAPVRDPRRANPSLPTDLCVVLETVLERDVARRYPTALELAEELRRVREYEPIRARPAGPVRVAARWARRHPVLATTIGGSIAALSIALSIALVLLDRVRDEERRKEAALQRYQAAYDRDFATSTVSLWPMRALEYAIAAAERDPGLASNRSLLLALDALYQKQALAWPEGDATNVDVDARSRRIVTASTDGVARLWDAETGVELARFDGHRASLGCVRFAPDDARVVTASDDGTARVWRTDAPSEPPIVLAGHAAPVQWAEFSPDGALVVTAGRDHAVRVWDAASGKERFRCDGHAGNVSEARFVGGGRWILTRSGEPLDNHTSAESDRTARLFDARTGAQRFVFARHTDQLRGVACSPDVAWIATASADRTALLYHVDERSPESPEPVRRFEAEGKFHAVDFSPDGKKLALAWDAGAKVVDVESGATLYELPSHDRRAVVWIGFSPDGERLATVAYDCTLRLFRASDGALQRTCRGDTRSVHACRWSPDARWLATWQRAPQVDLWYAGDRPFLQVLRGHTDEVVTARFDADAQRVVTASKDGTARVWSAKEANELLVIAPPKDELRALVAATFTPDGSRVVTTDERGRVRLSDASTGVESARFDGASPTSIGAIVDRGGRFLAMQDGAGGVRVVELATLRSTRLDAHEAELGCMRFSDDGTTLATGGTDRRVCAWDLHAGGAELATSRWRSRPFDAQRYDLTAVFDVAFDPTGREIAAVFQSMEVAVFDAWSGKQLASGRAATAGHVAFTRDGSVLFATSKWINTAATWRVAREDGGVRLDRFVLSETVGVQHANSITSLASARGADRLLTGSLDHGARLWDARSLECIAAYPGHADAVWDVDVSADGTLVVTASADHTARLWPGDPLALAKRFQPRRHGDPSAPLPASEPASRR